MTSNLSYDDILAQPASPPPPGVTPNFENPPNIQLEGRAAIIVGLVVVLLVVAIRLFTQWGLAKKYAVEDFVLLLGICFAIPQLSLGIVSISPGCGGGIHIWDITIGTLIRTLRYLNYSQIMYMPSYFFIKIAIILQLQRIFAPTRQTHLWFWLGCWAFYIVLPLFYLAILGLSVFQCWPREKIWNPSVPGRCIIGTPTTVYIASWFNVVSDVLMLALPIPAIWQLQMSSRRKFLVGGLFSTGGLAIIASIVRLYYSWRLLYRPDATYTIVPLGTSVFYEYGIIAIVFCLPVAPKFIQFITDKWHHLHVGHSKLEGSDANQIMGQQNEWSDRSVRSPKRRNDNSTLGVSSVLQYLGPESRSTGHMDDSVEMKSHTDVDDPSKSDGALSRGTITEGRSDVSGNSMV